MGFKKTLNRLTEKFTWKNMVADTWKFIAECTDCQLVKYETAKPRGLLCSLPVPSQPWEDLLMDFIVGLPAYKGHTCIFMVVDRFSKGIHLGMLPMQHTTQGVAQLFMEMVGKIHGIPRSIVSDRDPLFTSKFWQTLFSLSGTKIRMSSAYHPQTDGQTEVANRVVEQYLRAFVHRKPSTWGRFLLWVERSYNTSVHSTTGLTPFEVTFGRKPPNYPRYVEGSAQIEAVDEWLSQREEVIMLLKQKLLKAQACMKNITDEHRRDHNFNIGDWVLVKLRPYKQTTVKGSTHSKLAKRFFEPFQIIERLGPVAYKLALPEDSRIHPVFRCSLLKPFIGSLASTQATTLPPSAVDNQPVLVPLAILGHKTVLTEAGPKELVLVQWKDLHPNEASWEEWNALKSLHHLVEKVLFEGSGNDTSSSEDSRKELQSAKPKRQVNIPTRLRDYVLQT